MSDQNLETAHDLIAELSARLQAAEADKTEWRDLYEELHVKLEAAETENKRHDRETSSIHADMLALGRAVGAPYDGLSSPAGYLHGDIMPKVANLQSRIHELQEAKEAAEAEIHELKAANAYLQVRDLRTDTRRDLEARVAELQEALERIAKGFDRGIEIYEEHGGFLSLNEPIIQARQIARQALHPIQNEGSRT